MKTLDTELATDAKAIVGLAFRNGPIEDVHAGKACPVCCGSSEYSRITDEEMKAMMKFCGERGLQAALESGERFGGLSQVD
jgi:hypothetical protein